MRGLTAIATALLVAGCTTTIVVGPSAQPTTTTTLAPISSQPPATGLPLTPSPNNPGSPGGIDASFGVGGLVVTDMGGTDDTARAVGVANDGIIIVVGEARADAQSLVSFAVMQYVPDGSPNLNFGDEGKVYTQFDEFNSSGALAVAIEPDNRFVVVGHAANPEVHHDTFALARYLPDGSLDTNFGVSGQVLTAIWPETGAGPVDRANAVAIDSLGRIVVAGETGSFLHDFAVARYLPDGSLDTTFGDGGLLIHDLGGDDRANSVAIEPDGSILVGGSGWVDSGADDFVLVRYLEDGSLDPSFGNGGVAVTDFRGGDDRAQSVLRRPDGRIALAGTYQASGGCSPSTCERYGFGMAQYNANGTLDATFGTGGKIEPDFLVSSGAYSAALMPNGVIALGGHIGNEDFGLSFVNTAGGPILIEDGSEAVRIDFQGGSDRAFGAALGPGNSIVLAGDAADASGAFDFGMARYIAPTP